MTEQTINNFLLINAKYFDVRMLPEVKQLLQNADERLAPNILAIDFKDPTTMLLFSIFLGAYGVDRFILGDVGMGILKLLTGGLCGVLYIIDAINIQQKTKDFNLNALRAALSSYGFAR
ncbi:MAG: TM2 domain-containing protein [Bacteroidales bacterium]|nr:TM2 domain-containing protein [Porphyromonas sp.]MDD6933945.1 TM2 domain-containing protein [Bacteroidales bacterium]MDY3102987.1 TM2 domain-containing protein [Porphyromonas sp.]